MLVIANESLADSGFEKKMTEDINFNVNLIELVGENPLLYDLFHEDYKNLSKTAQVWKKISSELGESGKLPLLLSRNCFA